MKRKNVVGNFLLYSMSLLSSSSSLFVFKVRNFLKMNSTALTEGKKSQLFGMDWKKCFFFCEILVFFFTLFSISKAYIGKKQKKAAAEEKNNIFFEKRFNPIAYCQHRYYSIQRYSSRKLEIPKRIPLQNQFHIKKVSILCDQKFDIWKEIWHFFVDFVNGAAVKMLKFL